MAIEALEAKTRLSALLDRVARGEEIVITKHGRPVARLVPAAAAREDVGAIIARIKVLCVGQTLGGLSWKDLRDEGRR
jgi:prevent-host-death family protein